MRTDTDFPRYVKYWPNTRASAISRLLILSLSALASSSCWGARLKDIANIRGARDNQLIGYGLVVGLAGTGDSTLEFTDKSMRRMLDKLGMKTESKSISSKNVAAVLVTATLPPFARAGNTLDVTVNSIGDAKSLDGGTLVQTPLRAANEKVYAVAQGSMVLGTAGGNAKPFLTVGQVPNGAIIEQDVTPDFSTRKMFRITLHNPDFTTAARVVSQIDLALGGKYATALDAATIDIVVPPSYEGRGVQLLANIESLQVNPDNRAVVVVNERTGTVVIGSGVRISECAISHGDLSVQVSSTSDSKSKGQVTGKLALIGNTADGTASVGDIVNALNLLGVSPKDLITILENIKAAGALQGDLEVL